MQVFEQTKFKEPLNRSDEPLIIHRHRNTRPHQLIVLVHGLGGTRYGRKATWGNIPSFLFNGFPELDIGLYEYRTLFRRWKFWESVAVEVEAATFANVLRDAKDYDTILLAGHSLGGLLCMAALQYFVNSNQREELERIRGLYLMATPQTGSQRVPRLLSRLSRDFYALRPHGSFVTGIHRTFINHFNLDEGVSSRGRILVPTWAVLGNCDFWVDRLSAGLNLPDSRCKLARGSHTSIVKPRHGESDEYKFLKDNIGKALNQKTTQQYPAGRTRFDRLIKRHTKLFGGRTAAFQAINDFISRPTGGYLVITGPRGVGKTALIAQLVDNRRKEFAYHFFTRQHNDTLDERFFLHNIIEQMAQWHPDKVEIPSELDDLKLLYRRMLGKSLEDTRVIVLDGLDEVARWPLAPYLSRSLKNQKLRLIVTLGDTGQNWREKYDFPEDDDEVCHLPIGALGDDEVARVLRQAGPRAKVFADDLTLLARVVRLASDQSDHSAGADPSYVRHLAEDAAAGRLTPRNLGALPQGFERYLDRCWRDIRKIAGEGAALDVFGTLAVALGPIARGDLVAINPRLRHERFADSLDDDDVAAAVERWVERDPAGNCVLSQTRLRDYLRTQMRTGEYLARLLEYCARWTEHKSAYALRHLTHHLIDEGEWDRLAQMFAHADFVVERGKQFGFDAVHADALLATQAKGLPPEWQTSFAAWERFLRRRIERFRSFPSVYAQEVVNEFLPSAVGPLGAALAPLRNHLPRSNALYLKKTFGPLALGSTHTGRVYCLAFSADGRFAISGSYDRSVRIWDLRTGDLQAECVGHTDLVRCVAFSEDGRFAVSGGHDRTVKVWDATTGRRIADCVGHEGWVSSVAFSPNGRLVGSADQTVKIWEAETGRLVSDCLGHDNIVTGIAFSRDGRLLASASNDKTVRLWAVDAGRELAHCIGHEDFVTCVSFSADVRYLASGSYDGTVRVWDTATGQPVFACAGVQEAVQSVVFSSDGELIAAVDVAGAVSIWQAASGARLCDYTGHAEIVHSIAFDANGQLVADSLARRYTAMPPRAGALMTIDPKIVKVWEAQTKRLLATCVGHSDDVVAIAFTPDGRLLASASKDETARVWDTASGRQVSKCIGHAPVNAVAFSPDGRFLASASEDGTATVWNVETGTRIAECVGHTDIVNSVAFSPDGSKLASGSNDRTVKEWDTWTGHLIADWPDVAEHAVRIVSYDGDGLVARCHKAGMGIFGSHSSTGPQGRQTVSVGHIATPGAVAFSEDRRLIGASDRLMRSWTGWQARQLPVHVTPAVDIGAVALSKDGQRIAVGGAVISLRNTETGLQSIECGHVFGNVRSLVFSSNGRLLGSASYVASDVEQPPDIVTVWAADTGRRVSECPLPKEVRVVSLAFSPDARLLAAGCSDGSLRLWDPISGNSVIGNGLKLGDVDSIAFFPNGRFIASGGATVMIWETQTGQLRANLAAPSDTPFQPMRLLLSLYHYLLRPIPMNPTILGQ